MILVHPRAGQQPVLADVRHAVAEHPDLRPAQRDLRAIPLRQRRQFRQHHVGVCVLAIGEQPGCEPLQVGDVESLRLHHDELETITF